ncbi:hypothetical protein LV779_04780 [Streptomyces thinghirensis]|nr:hypothetical protein [Streptomyces thinghirensis]
MPQAFDGGRVDAEVTGPGQPDDGQEQEEQEDERGDACGPGRRPVTPSPYAEFPDRADMKAPRVE